MFRTTTPWRAALACGMALLAASAHAARDVVVRTDAGEVRGFADAGVREFRGIPFAAPPIGDRRFAPPAPVARWSGVRDATRHRSPCPQVVRYGQTDASDDEDCLYLNVAAPDDPPGSRHAPRAVLVWIHGGAYVGGSADIHPLRRYAVQGDLVIVSINYRLGALGFLAHPALDPRHAGALGLEDQRAAMRWVRRNVRAFGGDPARVTVAGESAGASSVCWQRVAPAESAGLFHRAVMQSIGCPLEARSQAEAVATAQAFARRLGCGEASTAARCLRAKPVADLLAAQGEIAAADPRAFAPSLGTVSTPRQPRDALATGRFVRVPILNGANRDEMRLYVGYEVAAGAVLDATTIGARLRAIYGANAERVAAEYPRAADDPIPAWLGRLTSDFMPGGPLSNCLALATARLASRYVPVYQYEFTDEAAPPVMPDPGFPMGAVHAAEMPYFFPAISYNRRIDGPPVPDGSRALADRMLAYWSAFAREGRPHVPGSEAWPRYAGDGDVLRLDPRIGGTFDAAASHRCAFWRSLYPAALP